MIFRDSGTLQCFLDIIEAISQKQSCQQRQDPRTKQVQSLRHLSKTLQ